MPIHCSVPIHCISQNEFAELDYVVMSHAFQSQNDIGRLAHEQIYQNDMTSRLALTGFGCEREVGVRLTHKDYLKVLFLDLVVDSRGVYELKTVMSLTKDHESQLLTYLYLLDVNHGKLVTFRTSKVESRFVNATLPRSERIGFSVCADLYSGPTFFRRQIVAMLRDWGTCLSLSIYRDATVHLLGGTDVVERMLPLSRLGSELGNQRFHLISGDEAFHFTAFPKINSSYDEQIKQLLSLSPLRAIHRINVAPHQLALRTILKEG